LQDSLRIGRTLRIHQSRNVILPRPAIKNLSQFRE
jgi:hypothetical protein